MEQSGSGLHPVGGVKPRAGKYLSFVLAGEEYGVEILRVREIIGMMDTTAIPGRKAHLVGVINLRGTVIPVIDLRRKFGMPHIDRTAETCIIVVDVHGQWMGAIVDKVSEVLDIAEGEIEDAPSVGLVGDSCILGMAKSKGRVKILLEIAKVLSEDTTAAGAASALEIK